MSIELSIIIPTFNERENVSVLLERIEDVLRDIKWEVIFVDDDSPDKTAEHVRSIGKKDPRIRCVQRIGRRGLSSACIEGMLASNAQYLAVMDADLQHDESLLPEMYNTLKMENLDIVVGSRYVEGGGTGEWSTIRKLISRMATWMGVFITKTELKDSMSGFFMLNRTFFEKTVHHLTGQGFKILLDLFASSPEKVRFKELPFIFKKRHAGESKLDTLVVWEYLLLLADKFIGRFIPVRFVLFVIVGFLGAFVHIAVLWVSMNFLHLEFLTSQVYATVIAMTMNFILDNFFTYHDRQLKGWTFVKGLLSFYIACSIGAVANIQVAIFLFNQGVYWWLAGLLGAIIGAVWNYTITATFTWSDKKKLN